MKNFLLNIFIWFGISIFSWAVVFCIALFFVSDLSAAELHEIPTVCESQQAKIKEIERQFANKIFIIWLRDDPAIDKANLYDKARYTAWYILRDNGIVCRHYK